jgi:hypothetical protein
MSVNVVRAIGYRIQQDYLKGEWIYGKEC